MKKLIIGMMAAVLGTSLMTGCGEDTCPSENKFRKVVEKYVESHQAKINVQKLVDKYNGLPSAQLKWEMYNQYNEGK